MHYAAVLNYIEQPNTLSMKAQLYRAFGSAKTI